MFRGRFTGVSKLVRTVNPCGNPAALRGLRYRQCVAVDPTERWSAGSHRFGDSTRCGGDPARGPGTKCDTL